MDWHTIKIRLNTFKVIKLVCAVTGESIGTLIHRLVVEEWGRVKDRAIVDTKPIAKRSKSTK